MTVMLCRDAVRSDADEDGSGDRAVAVPRGGGPGDSLAHAVHAHLFRHPVQEAGAPDVRPAHVTSALATVSRASSASSIYADDSRCRPNNTNTSSRV